MKPILNPDQYRNTVDAPTPGMTWVGIAFTLFCAAFAPVGLVAIGRAVLLLINP